MTLSTAVAGVVLALLTVAAGAIVPSPLHPALDRAAPIGMVPISLHDPTIVTAAEPLSSASESSLLISTADPLAPSNLGVETNITGFPVGSLPVDTSLQVGVEETIGRYDAVLGLFENAVAGPIGFFDVFNGTTDALVRSTFSEGTLFEPNLGYGFRLAYEAGTVWNATLNGLPFGATPANSSFDFRANRSVAGIGPTFSEVAFGPVRSVVPPNVTATLAFAVDRPTGWYLPTMATATFAGNGSEPIGVEGRNQSPSLAPGEIRIGRSVPPVPNGTGLWLGGPLPVAVRVTMTEPIVSATAIADGFATVEDPYGNLLPGVPLGVTDVYGSSMGGGAPQTGATGSAAFSFTVANLSDSADDVVTVTSAIFGYQGAGTVEFAIVPATELFLSGGTNGDRFAPGSTGRLSILVALPNGGPAGAVAVILSASGGAEPSPQYAETGPDGRLSATVTYGSAIGTVSIEALVDQPGDWGHLNLTVTVENPPILPSVNGATFLIVGTVALVAAATLVVVVLRRRPRSPIPPFPLRSAGLNGDGPPRSGQP